MNFQNKKIILTGAGGGIGRELAQHLDKAGANLTLVDLNAEALKQTGLTLAGEKHIVVATDLTRSEGRKETIGKTLQQNHGIDMLINCAGINPFGAYEEQDEALIQKTMEVNMLAPMLLTHAVLPSMKAKHCGQIVNIGSTFGSIAFAWFTAYSATKFGLRGFSEALRRELVDTGIDVTYIAPRAVNTTINSEAVYEMAKVTKMKFDEPSFVAGKIMSAIAARKNDVYIGFPESLFVRINSIVPAIVDSAVKQQNIDARKYAVKDTVAT